MSNELNDFKYLFSPYQIGNVTIKNRMVFQPHVPYYGGLDGYPTERMKRYYIERAKGGTGLIVIESLIVHSIGIYAPGCILMYQEGVVEKFKDLPIRVHQYGSKIFGQLSHCGVNAVAKPAQLTQAASQFPDINGRIIPKEMDIETVKDVIQGFGTSALRLKEAGFDGCELKFAHDGLLKTFANPNLNNRTDQYGGSYENRMRFITEIVQDIKKKCGKEFPIGVRLNLDEYVTGGFDQEIGLQFAKTCEEIGCDYINGDAGDSVDACMQIPPMGMPLGTGVYLASAVKRKVKIPVVAFGRVNDPVLMEMVLEEGHADFVGSARQFICDAETANKALEGRTDEIRHCIACNEACIYQCMQAKPIRCAQNPEAGREENLGIGTLIKTNTPKKIMVIGGGIAGMKFAEIATRRGHKVELFEKENVWGGQINIAEKLPYRAEIGEVVRYIKIQLQKYNVLCNMNIKVNAQMVKEMNPDVVIVATGSRPYFSVVPGMNSTKIKVIDVRHALTNPEDIGNNVVVFDRQGHMQAVGICEFALALGAKVHYYTPFDKIGIDVDPITMQAVKRRIFSYDSFTYNTYFDLHSINEYSIEFQHCYGGKNKKEAAVDTLIYAQYSKSDSELYKELKEIRENVYSIGDCSAPRLIEQVLYESEMLARSL